MAQKSAECRGQKAVQKEEKLADRSPSQRTPPPLHVPRGSREPASGSATAAMEALDDAALEKEATAEASAERLALEDAMEAVSGSSSKTKRPTNEGHH